MFFDEMGSTFCTRGSGVENTIVSRLLPGIDGIEGPEHAIVIGAPSSQGVDIEASTLCD